MTRILVVDNYDSFVWTIVGYLEQLGARCRVVRNDDASLALDGLDAVVRGVDGGCGQLGDSGLEWVEEVVGSEPVVGARGCARPGDPARGGD